MIKYNLLWFDDDFEAAESSASDAENNHRIAFQGEVLNARKTYHCQVTGVSNFEDFCNHLHEIAKFQAAVLDLRGLEKDGKASDLVMFEALKELHEAASIPIYIYSSDTEDDHFELLISPMKQSGRCFNKRNGIEPLFQKIRADLDDYLHVYEQYPECLELFNEGYLHAENKPKMDAILMGFHQMDSEYMPYNSMRQIFEDLFNNLVHRGIIPDRNRTLNQRVDYVVKNCHRKPNNPHEYDYDNPMVPFDVCPREVKQVIHFVAEITNHNSHFFECSTSYLRKDESLREYKLLLQQTIYPAFVYVMKWYYGFMSNDANRDHANTTPPRPSGIIGSDSPSGR